MTKLQKLGIVWAVFTLGCAIGVLSAQTTVIQNSVPTYTLVGIDNGQTPYTIPAGATWRYGSPFCNVPPMNGSGWLYYTNKTGASVVTAHGVDTFGGDPAPWCAKWFYSQDPYTFSPVNQAYSCPAECVVTLSSTDQFAAIRVSANGEYVETLRLTESGPLYAAYTALANAQQSGAGADVVAMLKADVKAKSDAVAKAHGSQDTTTYTILDGLFIHIMNGKPLLPGPANTTVAASTFTYVTPPGVPLIIAEGQVLYNATQTPNTLPNAGITNLTIVRQP